ncbi:DUF927 domain-containing protein [Gallibacterium anatis]|uniref:DUF927 domain-containing protein n=1 Tax=Gallibacterium anatis TaxID=750 RepID=UPI0030078FF2
MMNGKLKKAPFLKDQPNTPLNEMIILAGSEAWQAWGNGNGQYWHLLTERIRSDYKQKPVILGYDQLQDLRLFRIAPENQKAIRVVQYGTLSSDQIDSICINLAKHTEADSVLLCNNVGELEQDLSGYIKRIREGDSVAETVQKMTMPEIEDKTLPYIEYRDGKLSGLYYVVPKTDKEGDIINEKATWLCDNLAIVGRGINQNNHFYYIFEWKHALNKTIVREAIPAADLGKAQAWDHFKNNGLRMSACEQLKQLVDYFHAKGECTQNWIVTNMTGWQGSAYLLPNGEIIGNPSQPIAFTAKSASKHGYSTAGTLESWQNEIGRYVVGNATMMLGVATALASPLLNLLNAEPFGVHLYNQSSKGKTTTLNIANSVYGNPKEIILTWNTTPQGINNEATARNDGFITLDELGQAKRFYEVENIAYSLFNGSGRIQGMKEGGNQEINRWKITALSTGEKDLETYLQSKGIAINAGQLVRLLNIPISEPAQLGEFTNQKAHADHLNEMALKNYGVIGRKWIAFLTENKALVAETYKAYNQQWLNRLPEEASSQVQRVASRFAILETALQLAANLTLWNEKQNSEALIKCFNDWLSDFGTNNREKTVIPEQLLGWIFENRDSRFIEYPFKPIESPIKNTAGYRILARQNTEEQEHFYIYPKAFKEALGEYPLKIACPILADVGMLAKGTEKDREYLVRLPKYLDERRPRVYLVYPVEVEEQETPQIETNN